MGNHSSSTIINSSQVKSRNSINYYSVEFLHHNNTATFGHFPSSFNEENIMNEVNIES